MLTVKHTGPYSAEVFKKPARSLRRDPEFQRVKAGGYTWWVRETSLDDDLLRVLEKPDSYLPDLTSLAPRERPSTSVAHVSNFFLKRFNRARPTKMFKSIFRIAPAQRAFCLANHLEQAGILTPRALAVTNKRSVRVLLRSYLVTENIPNATTLEQCRGRIPAAVEVASLLARLHREGFVHRDLNPTNILFDRNRRLLFVDLDTMRYIRHVPEPRAMDDVARFSRKALLSARISRSDRARFLKEYCRLRGVTDWRSWWRLIEGLNCHEYERLARKSKGLNPPAPTPAAASKEPTH